MDGIAFTVWATRILAPILEPGDIVVMDNLSVHKNSTAIEAVGAEIWDLPPYSSDLNPIEKNVGQNQSLSAQAQAAHGRSIVLGYRPRLGKSNPGRHRELVRLLRL